MPNSKQVNLIIKLDEPYIETSYHLLSLEKI